MTMPHLQNCPHDDNGWCLACVKELWEERHPPRDTSPRMTCGRDVECVPDGLAMCPGCASK